MSSPLVRTLAPLAVLALVTGCTGQEADDDTPAAPTASMASSSPAPSSPSPTASGEGDAEADAPFDCAAVSAAQQQLNDASDAELTRLGIDRVDPRAFTVVVLVASQNAAGYWQAVENAAQPSLPDAQQADLRLVTGYWTSIDAELDAIEVADSSEAAVRAASTELGAVSAAHPQQDLAAAQQRIQDVLAATCGTEPAPSPSSSP